MKHCVCYLLGILLGNDDNDDLISDNVMQFYFRLISNIIPFATTLLTIKSGVYVVEH